MNHSVEKQEKGAVTRADERLKDKTQWGCGEGWEARDSALIAVNCCSHPGRV